MDNRKCIYFVEGECEEKLLNALKLIPSLIINGKVKRDKIKKKSDHSFRGGQIHIILRLLLS